MGECRFPSTLRLFIISRGKSIEILELRIEDQEVINEDYGLKIEN